MTLEHLADLTLLISLLRSCRVSHLIFKSSQTSTKTKKSVLKPIVWTQFINSISRYELSELASFKNWKVPNQWTPSQYDLFMLEISNSGNSTTMLKYKNLTRIYTLNKETIQIICFCISKFQNIKTACVFKLATSCFLSTKLKRTKTQKNKIQTSVSLKFHYTHLR